MFCKNSCGFYVIRKEKDIELSKEIDDLISKASNCDKEEDQTYKEQTGYEIPEDLKFKQDRLKKIKAAKVALEAREEKLNPGKEIDDKKQISFADKDARIMGKKGDFDYRYNTQISVDADIQIIVGQHLSQHTNDKQEVEPALVAIKEATGQLPKAISADNGYLSGNNLQALEEESVDAYIATGKSEKKSKTTLDASARKLVKADFDYDKATDSFTCPGEQTLNLLHQGKDDTKVYQGDAEICSRCIYQSRCCQSEKGEARTINTDDKEPLRQKMNAKMTQNESKEIYKKRKIIVEPVFGQIKNSSFRGFSVRGKEKVAGEFSLICAAHNIKKMTKAIFRGAIRPKFSKAAVNAVI